MQNDKKLSNQDVKEMVESNSAWMKTTKGKKELLSSLKEADKISNELHQLRIINKDILQEPVTV